MNASMLQGSRPSLLIRRVTAGLAVQFSKLFAVFTEQITLDSPSFLMNSMA